MFKAVTYVNTGTQLKAYSTSATRAAPTLHIDNMVFETKEAGTESSVSPFEIAQNLGYAPSISAMHISSRFGLYQILERLIQRAENVNICTSQSSM